MTIPVIPRVVKLLRTEEEIIAALDKLGHWRSKPPKSPELELTAFNLYAQIAFSVSAFGRSVQGKTLHAVFLGHIDASPAGKTPFRPSVIIDDLPDSLAGQTLK